MKNELTALLLLPEGLQGSIARCQPRGGGRVSDSVFSSFHLFSLSLDLIFGLRLFYRLVTWATWVQFVEGLLVFWSFL